MKYLTLLLLSSVSFANVTFTATSNQSLDAGSVVYTAYPLGGKVALADKADYERSQVVGLAISAVGNNQQVTVLNHGVLEDVYNALSSGEEYFLGALGNLSLSKPSVPGQRCVSIGYAIASNKLLVDPKPCR